MNAAMRIEDPGVLVIALDGDVDVVTAPAIHAYVEAAMESGQRRVTFDLSAVDFLDTTGLLALVRSAVTLKANGGDCRLRRPSPAVRRILDGVRLADGLLLVDR